MRQTYRRSSSEWKLKAEDRSEGKLHYFCAQGLRARCVLPCLGCHSFQIKRSCGLLSSLYLVILATLLLPVSSNQCSILHVLDTQINTFWLWMVSYECPST